MNDETPRTIPSDARNWAMACHLAALAGLFGNGIGFIIGPLVVWLIKRDSDPYVDEQGKEALNFQITMLLAMLACIPLIFVVVGLLLLPVLGVLDLVLTIVGGVKAANGEPFRYPFAWRLIK